MSSFSTHHLHADLKGRSVRGGFWTLSSQGAQFLLQTVSTVVLARLLMPADFGLVAMVTAVTVLGQAFADLGLSEATIQSAEISQDQVSNLFWVNFAVGIILTLITAALAPVLVWFYREPRLMAITLVMSLTFLIGGLRVQHTALLKRQMRFRSLAIRDVLAYVIAVPVAVVMALRGASYWAVVALPLTSNLVQMVLSWWMMRWLPGLPKRGAKVGSLVAFGGNVAASYFITNITRSADSVLVGWYWGPGPLGLYSRAYNLLMLPVRQLNGPAGSVAIPAFSRLQADPERFARYYLRTVNLIVWISAPIFGCLFVSARPVITLVLGAKWADAAPVFQILVMSAMGQLLLDTTIWLLVSRGESSRLLHLLLVISPLMVASFAVGLRFGIKGVALCGSLALLLLFPGILRFAFRGTHLTLLRLAHAIQWPILLCLGGVAVTETVARMVRLPGTWRPILATALCFVAVYSFAALFAPVRKEIAAFRTLLHPSKGVAIADVPEILEAVA